MEAIALNPIYALEVRIFNFSWLAQNGVTANLITIFRALLVIPALIMLYYGLDVMFYGTMVASYWGDHLDGLFARTQNQVTSDGAYLDRSLDKLVNIAVMVFFAILEPYAVCQYQAFKVAILVLATKEMVSFIVGMRHWWLEKYESENFYILDNRAGSSGKIKMLLESVLIMLVPIVGLLTFRNVLMAEFFAIGFNATFVLSAVSLMGHIEKIRPKAIADAS